MKTITLRDGASVPAIGQGTWRMGERSGARASEVAALRRGIDLGLTLIDTAEMYAEGGAEEVVGEAIAGERERVFLVSKAYPQNASRTGLPAACERSLKRLGVEQLDLYLLHWRGGVPLAETVEAFEALVAAGRIARWGVSNFDVSDMEELWRAGGGACAANQVLYNPERRGIEFDLLPWCARHEVPVMAYSPVGQGGALLRNRGLTQAAASLGVTAAQLAVAWSIRSGRVVSIPKAADVRHVEANAAADAVALDAAAIAAIDAAYPVPAKRKPLEML